MSTHEIDRWTPTDIIAGFLSSFAIFFSVIGIAWHPLRLVPISVVLALIATAMGGRNRTLAFAALLIGAGCFFLGMTVAVITSHPLW